MFCPLVTAKMLFLFNHTNNILHFITISNPHLNSALHRQFVVNYFLHTLPLSSQPLLRPCRYVFLSSPGQIKLHVKLWHHLAFVVCSAFVDLRKLSYCNRLQWNHWALWIDNIQELCLLGPMQKVIISSWPRKTHDRRSQFLFLVGSFF